MNIESLFAALNSMGQVATSAPPEIALQRSHAPWYTRALMGGMGWLGGMLVLGFVGGIMGGLFDSAPGMAVVAVAMFAGSVAIYRTAPKNDFATQFALAASICGQVLAAVAIGKMMSFNAGDAVIAWLVALMQVVLVLVMPNFLHRLLSTLFVVAALFFATRKNGLSVGVDLGLALGWVALLWAESRLVAQGRRALSEPVINGLAVGLLAAGIGYMVLTEGEPWLPHTSLSSTAFGAALLVWVVLATAGLAAATRAAAVAATLAFVVVSWRAPGLLASGLVLLASFAAGRRALSALGLVSLLGYLSAYYYQMSLSLLDKAGVLGLTGAVLLVLWWVHRHYFSKEPV